MDSVRTIEHVVRAIDGAAERREPFHHLHLSGIFPPEVYAAMLENMPGREHYGAMSGRARRTRTPQGGAARTRIDLFPEGMLRLDRQRKALWAAVGRVLRSEEVRDAFVQRLAPALQRRFGERYRAVRMYPIPILARDVPGYGIGIHPDTAWKGITVQLYLPRDHSIEHVGTAFHRRNPDSTFDEALRMPFVPNSGYAFAVGSDTYHSVHPVGPEVVTRDSILLNYFVDETLLQAAQNRTKRLGHLVRGLGWR
jgi:hypothetical protein